MPLYHKDLGFPENLIRPSGIAHLTYSHHARQAALTDRYEPIELLPAIDFDNVELVEVECKFSGQWTKAVVRARYNRGYDICLVVVPGGFVKTVWLNERDDTHATLKYGRYSTP